MKVSNDIANILKSYVYVYIDPRNGKPFYIGKGKGSRLFYHLGDTKDSDKAARIAAIHASGKFPQIDILRYGLSDSEADLVEAAAIDLIGKQNLTNLVSGKHDRSFPRMNYGELETIFSAKPVMIRHKAVLITINKLYRSNMTPLELYEATRGIWKIGPRRDKAEYAMAVYQGVVREVYEIKKWYPAGTLKYKTRDTADVQDSSRWEFSGSIAQEIRGNYINHFVGKSTQNPIRYVNL